MQRKNKNQKKNQFILKNDKNLEFSLSKFHINNNNKKNDNNNNILDKKLKKNNFFEENNDDFSNYS